MKVFEGESMKTQIFFHGHKIDLYFLDWKLAIECTEKEYKDCDVEYEIRRRKAIEVVNS